MKGKSNSAILLIETITCICFFAVTCAIVLQVLAAAEILSVKSLDITWAGVEAQSIAEQIKADPYRFTEGNDNKKLYFDDKYAVTSPGKAVFTAEVILTKQHEKNGELINYSVVFTKKSTVVFELKSAKYFPKEAA